VTIASALALAGIRHRFGHTLALDDAHLTVAPGTVHALLGENGAGKSTLMRIAFGMLAPDAGTLAVQGRPVQFRSSADAIAAGLGMVHQHFALVGPMRAVENVALGSRGRLDLTATAARMREVAARTGLSVDPDAVVATLSVAAQQRLEIVKALVRGARVLILDEPGAVLTPDERADLDRWLRQFCAGGGTAVLITHKVREALAVADAISVLRRGRSVLEAPRADVDDDAVVAAMTGEALRASPAKAGGAAAIRGLVPTPSAEPVLALDAVTLRDARGVTRLRDVTLRVARGEVLGVIGVEGAGVRELLRVLAGRLAPTTGSVRRPLRVGFIPEDRLHDAIVPAFSLAENLALADAGHARGRLDWRGIRRATADVLTAHDVRNGTADRLAAELSGGNQQKFVVGRERRVGVDALVAENPTRGLDLRAAASVLAALRDAAARGADGPAVVFHSTDLDEVLAVATRVVACFNGGVREVPPPTDPEDRTAYARALVGTL